MKKILLAVILMASSVVGFCQTYNNEWIDYNKTYYKFTIGTTGLYRISKATLTTAGIGNSAAQDFQLWHNGTEVTLFTSVATGTLGAADFLEFYGEMNDGKLDTKLYKYDSLQMNDKYSLYTDSSAYYLTINPGTANKRFANPGNDVANNTLSAEPYFMHVLSKYYREQLQRGYGISIGDLVHAASYETAEGWASTIFGSGGTFFANNSNLSINQSGGPASLNITVAGNTAASRTVTVKINSNVVASGNVQSFNTKRFVGLSIPLTTLANSAANFEFTHNGPADDNIMVASYKLTYPRNFDFGGATQFYFELSSGNSRYLEIANFNAGAGDPVLYDLANNLRITGVVSGGLAKFVLPAATNTRKMILLSSDPARITAAGPMTQRNFIDYAATANQGDYLIISHKDLLNDGTGINNVELYRQYRSSAAGGGYNAKILDVDQLTDQFAFGVKHHPAAIKTFSAYALSRFASAPKFLFLIGKGLNYYEFRNHESDPNVHKLALVPTFGYPSSDNLLTATRTGGYPVIPIGRLAAITGTEIGYYLAKIKQFELAQTSTDQTVKGKGWMKNIGQLTGGLSDPGLFGLITNYMNGYETIAQDSLFGADVYQFSANSGSNTAIGTNKTIDDLFSEGLTMLTYFGHSSPNTIEFNLDNPENYNNTGKYPLIIVNGCNSGDLFQYDTLRAVSKGSLSEKFVFANQKGSIAYIASTHFGLPTQLNYVNVEFYNNLCKDMYGQTLGEIMKGTMQFISSNYSYDYIAQTHAEEITLHGDPAIRMNPHAKPDYVIEDSLITLSPSQISVADTKISITARILNIGKAIHDSITVVIKHQLPDNSIVTLATLRRAATVFSDSINIELNINPIKDKGLNKLIVTIDPANLIPELSEANNTVTKNFTIVEDEIRPVYPFEYAIVHNASPVLFGSTANPTAAIKNYVMEMDTTNLFNSPLKIIKSVNDSGGVIQFIPGITLKDSTVYYWRVTVGPVTGASVWLKSSFVYINNGTEGYNQSHYFQFKNDKFNTISLDSIKRKLDFEDKTRRLLIRTGLYPYYSYDQINVNIDDNQLELYGCKYNAIQIVVYDSLTLEPWANFNTNNVGRFGSWPICTAGTRNFFEFPYDDSVYRRRAMQFLDSIPVGNYVSISNLGWIYGSNYFIDKWKADTMNLGPNKSLWHKFQQLGLTKIDSFTSNLPFLFIYKQGGQASFPVKQSIGPAVNNQIIETNFIKGKKVEGTITTPWFGPVKAWDRFQWHELPFDENSTTEQNIKIIGRGANGEDVELATIYDAKDTSIAFIDATEYPELKLQLYNKDAHQAKTRQLDRWTLTGSNVPEGGVSPNMIFKYKDTLNVNDTLHFQVGFKNTSTTGFDSIAVRFTITDRNGNNHVYNNLANGNKLAPLAAGDSTIISYDIPMGIYFGQNQVLLEVNPDSAQAEKFHFNNYLYRSLFVTNPSVCPGGSMSLSAGTSATGNTYRWQVKTGTTFTNLVNSATYQGTTTNTLLMNNLPTSMYGYKYRCAITNNNVVTYSPEYTLKFILYWSGAVSTAWENAANWSCAVVPDSNTDVIIRTGVPRYPEVSTPGNCRSITTNPGTSVTVKTGATLLVKGPPGP